MPDPICSVCSRAITDHPDDTHVRMTLPDPVLESPDREHTAGTWMSHDSPAKSVMMQAPNLGAFVRALLPVHLSEGTVTFGVWVAIDPRNDALRAIFDAWSDEVTYPALRLDGLLANRLRPWDVRYRPVTATVLDPDQCPYCTSSTDPELSAILSRTWDREWVLNSAG